MNNNLERGIKVSEMALAMAGAKDAIIIATDGVEANGSVPKEAVKKYLEEEC